MGEIMPKIITTKTLGKTGRKVHFIHRDHMRNPHPLRRLDAGRNSITIPATTLPVDSDNNGAMPLGPSEGNVGDSGQGDCGEAMVSRADNVLTYGQGQSGYTESVFTTAALLAQYDSVSGGDNGLDEDQVTTQIWSVGIAGNSLARAVSYLDFDCTNTALTQYLTDQFYGWCMGWSVPDKFIQNWEPGSTWMSAMTPDDANGHFTWMCSVLANGGYRQYTWDAWDIAGPDFIASVQPQAFVAFSPRQFSLLTGLDSKGRHITSQAGVWASMGGAPIPLAVIAMFPPIGAPPVVVPVGPVPTPVTPTPTPVTPTPAPVVTPPTPLPGSDLFTWSPSLSEITLPDDKWYANQWSMPEIQIHPHLKIVYYPKGQTVT
jgi:hypothetical protein